MFYLPLAHHLLAVFTTNMRSVHHSL